MKQVSKDHQQTARISEGASRVLADLDEGADALDVTAITKLDTLRRPGGSRPSTRAIWRLFASGKLDSAFVMGRRVSTAPAVLRMLAAANSTTPAAMVTPRQREKQLDKLERRLAASGI